MNMVTPTKGMPGDTFNMTSTDTAQALTAASILGSGGNPCIGALITFETNDIRFAMGGTTPVAGGTGHLADVSLGTNCVLWLDSGNAVKTFEFISNAAGVHGVISVTPFFEFGKT